MKCHACSSEQLQPIKVFAGHHAMGWSPVAGEKDLLGHYKKLRPLLAHACTACGSVNWNIQLAKPENADDNALALDELAAQEYGDEAEVDDEIEVEIEDDDTAR